MLKEAAPGTKGIVMPSNQFVVINFSEDRTVFAGGNPVGQTNCLLTINSGTHTFTLGDPPDYSPPSQTRKVSNTSVVSPLTLLFQKTAPTAVSPVAPGSAATPDSTAGDATPGSVASSNPPQP
jgi:hypothetical protein